MVRVNEASHEVLSDMTGLSQVGRLSGVGLLDTLILVVVIVVLKASRRVLIKTVVVCVHRGLLIRLIYY